MIDPVTSIPINWNTIIMALITMIGGVLTAYIMRMNGKVNAMDKTVTAVDGTTKETHKVVNTNYQRMAEALDKSSDALAALNERFLRIQDSNVVMREAARTQEVTDARIQGQAQGRESRRVSDAAPPQPQEVNIIAPVVNVTAEPPNVPEIHVVAPPPAEKKK